MPFRMLGNATDVSSVFIVWIIITKVMMITLKTIMIIQIISKGQTMV